MAAKISLQSNLEFTGVFSLPENVIGKNLHNKHATCAKTQTLMFPTVAFLLNF